LLNQQAWLKAQSEIKGEICNAGIEYLWENFTQTVVLLLLCAFFTIISLVNELGASN
jgi:hypothetical protein